MFPGDSLSTTAGATKLRTKVIWKVSFLRHDLAPRFTYAQTIAIAAMHISRSPGITRSASLFSARRAKRRTVTSTPE